MNEIITQEELQKKIGLSYSALHCHLACFEKYVVYISCHKKTYIYNLDFLTDLRTFYKSKTETYQKRNRGLYNSVIAKIDGMIKQWKLKENKKLKKA